LESELNQAEDSKIKLELISQLQDVQNYAGKVLDNRGARAQNLGQYYFKSAIQWRLDGVQLDAESERLDAENKELKAQRLDEKISSQMDEIKELKAQIAINASLDAKIKELKAGAAADKKNSGNTKTR
jgi:nitrate reductase alpha subunit